MLRFGSTALEQRPGRASQRGGPEGPQDQDIQEEAGGLRQRLVRRASVRAVVHPHHRHQATGETPFFLIYGAEAVLPHEVRHRSAQVLTFDEACQDASRGVDLVLGKERRRQASLRVARYEQALRWYHCRSIRSRTLEVGDLVLRRVLSREGLHKLSPMCEGLFRIARVSRPGATRLET